jgi:hypothetical protein
MHCRQVSINNSNKTAAPVEVIWLDRSASRLADHAPLEPLKHISQRVKLNSIVAGLHVG